MENPLLKKLRIKPGFKVTVFKAPADFKIVIGTLPQDINFAFQTEPANGALVLTDYDALLIFALTKADLLSALASTGNKIQAETIAWILYPKAKSKLAGDLNLMQSWSDLEKFNLVPCASAAIGAIWTAIRIKPIGTQKKSGIGNAELTKNDYGTYIDVAAKKVTLPADLSTALTTNAPALHFYETLTYSHRKEYVLWILTAKQEKTRLDRINKMVEKLLTGKKNPNEK